MRDKGLSPLRAAVFGTARVFWANNGTTAVAIASFLPLFAMGGDTGEYIKGMPTAVDPRASSTSLLVAQLFTPWVATFVLRKPAARAGVADDGALRPHGRTAPRGRTASATPRCGCCAAATSAIIPWVVAPPGAGGRSAASCCCSLGLAGLFRVIGFQFFPKADKPVALRRRSSCPRAARLERTAEKLVEACASIAERSRRARHLGRRWAGPIPEVFSSRIGHADGSHVADILVRLQRGQRSRAAARACGARSADLVGRATSRSRSSPTARRSGTRSCSASTATTTSSCAASPRRSRRGCARSRGPSTCSTA